MAELASPSHAFLRHADGLRLILRAQNFGELAAEGGRALGERLRGSPGEALGSGSWLEVDVAAPDREAMLIKWLNRLLDLSEWLQWAPVECRVTAVSDSGLRAQVRGVSLPRPSRPVRAVLRPNSHLGPDGRDLLADVMFQDPRTLIGCAASGGG